MRLLAVAAGALALSGCVSVTVTEEMARRDPVDCADPVPVTAPGTISVQPVASHPIADAPGKTLTSILLTVPPGAKANAHRMLAWCSAMYWRGRCARRSRAMRR